MEPLAGRGRLYTQYGAAVGGLGARIFSDLQGPPGDILAGDPLVLAIDAGGTPPLTFYWRTNGVLAATTSSNTLVLANSKLSDSGSYDVIISNSVGKVSSSPVSVSVVTPAQPSLIQLIGYNNRNLYPGATLSMAINATGGGLQYQWYNNGSPIAGATTSALTINNATNGNAGSYSVSVTNVVGSLTSGPPAVITFPTYATNSYEAAVVSAKPEAWWRLDEPAGSTNMFDGMGRHDGIYTNANGSGPLPTLGVPGALLNDTNTAASFSSTGMGIGLAPYSTALNPTKWSVEAWVNTAVLNAEQAAVSLSYTNLGWWIATSNGWWYGASYPGNGYFGNNLNGNTAAAIIPNAWSHVVILHDGTQSYPWTLYVNGKTDGYIWSGPTVPVWAQFIIGARGVDATTLAGGFFDGQVDEVAFYTRLLAGIEITGHYTARGTVNSPVTFTSSPLSQTVTTGKSISFSANVVGTTPIYLQWYKDGKIITDATNLTYSIASTALGDAGTYTLWGTNVVSTNSTSVSLVVISPVSYANVTNDLVLHLTFDGDTLDSSGRGNNGVASTTTAPTFVPGIIGSQALQYATVVVTNIGVSTNIQSVSYVTIGTVGSGPPTDLQFGATTSFSISLWVKQPNGALFEDLPFIGTSTNSTGWPGWVLAPSVELGGWQFSLGDNTPTTVDVNGPNNSINDGNWHNFVLTVDRTAKLANGYLDGVLGATASIASLGSMDNNNYWPIVIGQDPTLSSSVPLRTPMLPGRRPWMTSASGGRR